jgi:hypothetical protein
MSSSGLYSILFTSALSKIHHEIENEREAFDSRDAQGLAKQAGRAKLGADVIQDLKSELENAFNKIIVGWVYVKESSSEQRI